MVGVVIGAALVKVDQHFFHAADGGNIGIRRSVQSDSAYLVVGSGSVPGLGVGAGGIVVVYLQFQRLADTVRRGRRKVFRGNLHKERAAGRIRRVCTVPREFPGRVNGDAQQVAESLARRP